MAPKVRNTSTCQDKVNLNLERLKIYGVNKIKIDSIQLIMKPLATEIGCPSQDVKLFTV